MKSIACFEYRSGEVGVVGTVGEMLRFQAESLMLDHRATLAERCVEEIRGVQLHTRLIGVALHLNVRLFRNGGCRKTPFGRFTQDKVMVKTTAAPYLFVVGFDIAADWFELSEIKRCAVNR